LLLAVVVLVLLPVRLKKAAVVAVLVAIRHLRCLYQRVLLTL
jgi:hypothetical protein